MTRQGEPKAAWRYTAHFRCNIAGLLAHLQQKTCSPSLWGVVRCGQVWVIGSATTGHTLPVAVILVCMWYVGCAPTLTPATT